MNISNWEMALDSRFIRIHRSFLVNKAHITKISPAKLWIGEKSLEISRKYRDNSYLQHKISTQKEVV
jgi:DNA-binding LytR/AlgR family response regulator